MVGRYHTGKVTRHEKSQRPTFTEDFILFGYRNSISNVSYLKRILTRKNNFENFYFNRTRSARNLDMELKSHDLKMAPSGGSKNNGPMKSESQQSIVSRPEEEYVVYARRWFILIVIVILNLSNAMVRTKNLLKKTHSLLATELSVALLSKTKIRPSLSLFMQDAFKMSQL